jgi:hypothetical protein
MAVGLWIMFNGGTQEQYDAVDSHVEVDANPPDGLIFHSAGPTEGGWSIIDFWESRDHFDRFFEGRIGPAIAELGDRAPQSEPSIKEFPVTNIIKP